MRFLPLLVLVGCSSWIDQPPACELDVYEWSDDLLAHILQGKGGGGFAYDPVDVPRQNIGGSYDVETGDFSWSVDYVNDYWLVGTAVEGYGTAYHDGDLDILFTETHEDVLDDSWTTTWRVKREGCNMTMEGIAEGASSGLVREGRYQDDDSYSWSAEDNNYTYSGGMRRNLSRTVGIEAKDGSYSEYGTYKPEGDADIAWSGECYDTGYSCEATQHQRFDGGYDGDTTIFDNRGDEFARIREDYAYDGSGTSHWVFSDGTECDVNVDTDDNCTYSCSDGSDGRC